MFWVEKKKFLITCSEDKSVKVCQFPLYWPGEVIYGKGTVQKSTSSTLIKNNTIKSENQNDNFYNLFNNNEGKDKEVSSDSDLFDEYGVRKRIDDNFNKNINEKYKKELMIWSEDLDGWSYDIS